MLVPLSTHRRLSWLAVLLAAAATAVGIATPARAAEPGLVPDLTWYITDAEQDRTAAAMADIGARWVRLHVQWREAEPFPGSYDLAMLAHYDRAVAVSRAAGSRVAIMVYNAPAWASGSTERNTPTDPADFGAFMRFLAVRYAGQVAAYEIWNEPNVLRFWSTGRDPAAYTALLKAAYAGVKAGDPAARVVYAGLSFSDWQFLEASYAAGARGYFDVMATHPYTYCGTRDPEEIRYWDGKITEGSFVAYRNIRATMLAHGDDKPIWLTEFGWNTSSQTCDLSRKIYGGVTEQMQADYITRAFRILEQDPYVEVAFLYNFRNNYWSRDADVHHAQYGILRTDFSPKPAYYAFQTYAQAAAPLLPTPAPAPQPVNAPPVIQLTSPAQGATFNRDLAMAAAASDDRGVVKVEFSVDGTLVRTDTEAPYSYTWGKARKLAWGEHRVEARAYDAAGLTAAHSVTAIRQR